MAKKQSESTALARLTPNSKTIVIDGQDVRVAANKEENDVMNMILASQLRATIQEALKRYKDKDMLPNPRELKDLVDTAAKMTEFSDNVYKSAQSIEDEKEKVADKTDAPSAMTFDGIKPTETIDVEVSKAS